MHWLAPWMARRSIFRPGISSLQADGATRFLRLRDGPVVPILLDGIALAQLHTSTALQLSKALCGAVEL